MERIGFNGRLWLWTAVFLLSGIGQALPREPLSGKTLVEALQRGGYTIYFRHAATDWSQEDQVAVEGDWTSCRPDRMRQLSTRGRETARRIGASIRALGIPIGRIFSSEYCRARETAELMGLGPVVATQAIMNLRAADWVGGREEVVDRARNELGRLPKTGTNTIVVGHGNLMQAAAGVYTIEAGAGVFEPEGNGRFEIVAELVPEGWEALAAEFPDRRLSDGGDGP
jgi:phosphohistidine phosphatase SixA